jgi:hypothetical protein
VASFPLTGYKKFNTIWGVADESFGAIVWFWARTGNMTPVNGTARTTGMLLFCLVDDSPNDPCRVYGAWFFMIVFTFHLFLWAVFIFVSEIDIIKFELSEML